MALIPFKDRLTSCCLVSKKLHAAAVAATVRVRVRVRVPGAAVSAISTGRIFAGVAVALWATPYKAASGVEVQWFHTAAAALPDVAGAASAQRLSRCEA